MNEIHVSDGAPPPLLAQPIPLLAGPPRAASFSDRLRRLLACNPFYLVSAALLLFGVYQVSVDPDFLSEEASQLFFNFSSLQIYEMLLVVTAIVLARRRIWYDATLLAGLENLLVFVPFILVTQAALIDTWIVRAMCLAGGLAAVVRFGGLKIFMRPLNLPGRLLGMGLVMLAVNVALPVVYRILHESKAGTKPTWGAAYEMNEYAWLLILPAAFAVANFLPRARENGSLLPQRRWLPAGFLSLWMAATGVHLYCLGYVYDFDLRAELLAPVLWVLAWTAVLQVPRIFVAPRHALETALLIVPLPVALLAMSHAGSPVFLTLTGLNALAYGAVCFIERDRQLPRHLLFASTVLLIAGLPESWMFWMTAEASRGKCLAAAVAAYLILWTGLSRNPKLGVLGSVMASVGVMVLFGEHNRGAAYWALQSGLVFLLVHSLRWRDAEHPGAGAVRAIAAVVWVLHAVAWMRSGGEPWMACAAAAVVLSVYFVIRLFRGGWGQLLLPAAALLVILSGPGNDLAGEVRSMPSGLLAVSVSFVLFGMGTVAALTRKAVDG